MLVDSDFLPVILDYLGFVPARFFLRNTSRDAKKKISPKISVSLEELNFSLRNNLMPLKNLKIQPLSVVKSDHLVDVLAIESVADRCALLDQLFKTISPGALSQSLSWPEIERIKWTAWLSRNSRLLKLAINARETKRPRVPHFETEFLIDYKEDFHRFFKSDPIEYLSVVLREHTIPRTKDDWDFLIMNSLSTNAKRCLNFILTLFEWSLGEFPGVIAAATEGGDLMLLQHVIQSNDPKHPFIRDQMLRSLQISTRDCMKEATGMILNSLGPNCLSNSKSSLLHSLAMGNEVGNKATVELAKLLVSFKADISATNREGESALDIAAANGFTHLIDYYKSIGGKSSNMRKYLFQAKNLESFKSVVGAKGEYIDPKWIKKEKENPMTLLEYAKIPKCNGSIFLFLLDLLCLNEEKKNKLLRESFWAALEIAVTDGLFAERLDFVRVILKRAPSLAVEPRMPEGILPMGRILCVEPPRRRVWGNKVLPQTDLYESRLEPRRKVDDGSGFDDDEEEEEEMFGDDDFVEHEFGGEGFLIGGGIRRSYLRELQAREMEPEIMQKPQTALELAWDQSVLDPRQVVGISAIKQSLIACGADQDRGFISESLGFMVNEKMNLYIQPYTKNFLEFMIRYGADVNSDTRDRLGQRPIEMYSSVGCLVQCKVLIDHGAKVDEDLLVSASATTTSNVDVLKVLLAAKNCNVNGLLMAEFTIWDLLMLLHKAEELKTALL